MKQYDIAVIVLALNLWATRNITIKRNGIEEENVTTTGKAYIAQSDNVFQVRLQSKIWNIKEKYLYHEVGYRGQKMNRLTITFSNGHKVTIKGKAL